MISKLVTLNSWWSELDKNWKETLVNELELEDCFSLTDMEYVFLLNELDCSRTEISDLAPITLLSQLEKLDLSETSITDLSPLLKLPRLKELHITFSKNLDMITLGKLKNLEILDISYPQSELMNIHPISNLTNLREFYCNACEIDTVIHFMTLSKLEMLCGYFNQIPKAEIEAFRELMPNCKLLN